MTALRSCPACESAHATRLEQYSPAEWDVVSCDACGFVYLRNPPPYEALEEDFAWEKTYSAKRARGGSTPFSHINRWLRTKINGLRVRRNRRVAERLFGAGRVLDIGCAAFVRSEPPIVPYGIEISRALHSQADAKMRARGGYCLQAAGAEGVWQFEPDFFDGVILNSYLEHEAEPQKVLRGIFRALKPGGAVLIRVPNYGSLNRRFVGAKWCGFRHPDHVNYFTRASLARMAEKLGFQFQILNRGTLWLDDNIKAVLRRP